LKEARHYVRKDDGRVSCFTCAHRCVIAGGKRGVCGVMENRGGVLFSLVYGRAVAMHTDPIEKKPFFHFHPGAAAFSVATVGCNMRCLNCQNSDISQAPREGDPDRFEGRDVPPEMLVEAALASGTRIISYTYTEPAVYFDYALDTAILAARRGLLNTFVTNGYFSEESIRAAAPVLHAANVDLKSFRDETYRRVCGASLQPVLDAIRLMRSLGVWIEVTTLLIPGLNDSETELRNIAGFIRSVDPAIPWHVSRFFPQYRMTDRPPTPIESIRKALEIGLQEGLRYRYAGNLPGGEGELTFCWNCNAVLVERTGFQVTANRIREGRCPNCGAAIDGVW
jgi:pyruvate formate lyase activating enzyme